MDLDIGYSRASITSNLTNVSTCGECQMSENAYGVIPQSGNIGRKEVVISADKFEDIELYVPVFPLVEAGWEVDIAAPAQGKITGESNWYYVIANKTIDEIDPDDYDLLIIPGGSPNGAPAAIRTNKKA
jgi:hypothetical protein